MVRLLCRLLCYDTNGPSTQVEMRPNFVAFEIPDEFIVGYGLDYLDMYRNLPFIAVLSPAEIEATAAESKA